MKWRTTISDELDLTGWSFESITTGGLQYTFMGLNPKSFKVGADMGKLNSSIYPTLEFNMSNWVDNVDTLTSLYDRATNGLGSLTIKLNKNTLAKLTSDQKATITNLGYTLTQA